MAEPLDRTMAMPTQYLTPGPGVGAPHYVGPPQAGWPAQPAAPHVAPPPPPAPSMRGRASVPVSAPAPRWVEETPGWAPTPGHTAPATPERRETDRVPQPPGAAWRGWRLSVFGALVAFVCWGIWALANTESPIFGLALIYVVVLAVGVGVFGLCRLVGRFVLVNAMRRVRYTARPSHAIAALYLIAAGVGFLAQTPWVMDLINWFERL